MNYAFQYSVAMGAKVINLSWGIPSGVLFNTIEDSDALLVIAADNANTLVTPSTYPMVCNAPDNCIVVSSSELNDTKVTGAAYSSTYVDIFAPGANVRSVGYPTGTRSGSGTSYATPMVAAAAALIRSHATHLTAEDTKNLILNNVDVVPALEDYCVTGGRLAIDKAVDALYAQSGDVMVLNTSYIPMIEDITGYEDFLDRVEVVYTVYKKLQLSNEADKVDVTTKPFNILMIGNDKWGDDVLTTGRTDVNMIASVNPVTKQISFISIPRDAYVPNACLYNNYDVNFM